MQLKDVKKAIVEKQLVLYQDSYYNVTACILRVRNNAWYYQLELKELDKNSVLIVDMEVV